MYTELARTKYGRLLLPNLRAALIGSTLLTVAVVMGEFTFANVLLFHTFAVLINEIGQNAPTEAAALSCARGACTAPGAGCTP